MRVIQLKKVTKADLTELGECDCVLTLNIQDIQLLINLLTHPSLRMKADDAAFDFKLVRMLNEVL